MKRQKASLWTTKEKLLMLKYCYISYLFVVRSVIPYMDENGRLQIYMVLSCRSFISIIPIFSATYFVLSVHAIIYSFLTIFISSRLASISSWKTLEFLFLFVLCDKSNIGSNTIFLHYVVLNFLDRGSVMLKN